MDCSPPGSSVHGILQVRILKWVATPFSRGSSWPRDWTQVSCIAGGFFSIWATREAHASYEPKRKDAWIFFQVLDKKVVGILGLEVQEEVYTALKNESLETYEALCLPALTSVSLRFFMPVCLRAQSCPTLQPHEPMGFLCPWNFPGNWSVLPYSSLGVLANPRLELMSPALQADSLPLSHQVSPLDSL